MSILYVPDTTDPHLGGTESALTLAYPGQCFLYNTTQTIKDQMKGEKHEEFTVAVVHGLGWEFFWRAFDMGFFPNIRHVIVFGAKTSVHAFEEKKWIVSMHKLKTVHVLPVNGPGKPQYTEEDIQKNKNTSIVRLHGMHPDMQQCFYKNEDGEDAREEEPVRKFFPDELRTLVQRLVDRYTVPDEDDIHV